MVGIKLSKLMFNVPSANKLPVVSKTSKSVSELISRNSSLEFVSTKSPSLRRIDPSIDPAFFKIPSNWTAESNRTAAEAPSALMEAPWLLMMSPENAVPTSFEKNRMPASRGPPPLPKI